MRRLLALTLTAFLATTALTRCSEPESEPAPGADAAVPGPDASSQVPPDAEAVIAPDADSDPENTPEACRDGLDNDGDRLTDCADNECRDFCYVAPDAGATPENTSAACQDGADNDLDQKTDCADPECADFTFCQLPPDAGELAPDASEPVGPFTCTLDPAPVLDRKAFQNRLVLAALASAPGQVAAAYSQGGNRRVSIVDLTTGTEDDNLIVDWTDNAKPVALDWADGAYFLAGHWDPSSAANYVKTLFLDGTGAISGKAQTNDYKAVAATRSGAGGRLLAMGRPATLPSELSLYSLPFSAAGTAGTPAIVAKTHRPRHLWDMDERAGGPAVACGVTEDAQGKEFLSLFELGAGSVTPHLTARTIAPAPDPATGLFGCRLSSGAGFHAVVWAETDAHPRLAWMSGDAATLHGPVELLAAFRSATSYDVAANGAVTAAAVYDPNSGTPHVRIRAWQSPGAATTFDFNADEPLNLGAFDNSGFIPSVRVVRGQQAGEFFVAFDGQLNASNWRLVIRRLSCR